MAKNARISGGEAVGLGGGSLVFEAVGVLVTTLPTVENDVSAWPKLGDRLSLSNILLAQESDVSCGCRMVKVFDGIGGSIFTLAIRR